MVLSTTAPSIQAGGSSLLIVPRSGPSRRRVQVAAFLAHFDSPGSFPSAARLNFIRIITPSIATWISLILMSGNAATILSVSSVLFDRRACQRRGEAAV